MNEEKKGDLTAGATAQDPQADGQLAQPAELKFPALEKAEQMLTKLEEKEKLLAEREQALDKKLKQFDAFATEARISGFSVMKQEQPKDVQVKLAAKNMFKGTGLDPYPDLK